MIFVTGGTGLVGKDIIAELRSSGAEVAALVRADAGATVVSSMGCRVIRGAVEDPGVWHSLEGLDAIVHGAAIVAARETWARFEAVNVDATEYAIHTAARLGIPLIHISSVSVYGRSAADDRPYSITEEYTPRPLSRGDYYARSKRLADRAVGVAAARGVRATSLRPSVVYGPGDRLFLPKLIQAARRGWLPRIGPGDRPMPLVHSRSVATAVIRALETDKAWGRAFNITGDAPITAREVITALAEGLGLAIRSIQVPSALALAAATMGEWGLRLAGPRKYPGTLRGAVRFWRGGDPYSSEAARQHLGWNPEVDHRVALVDAVRTIGVQGVRR